MAMLISIVFSTWSVPSTVTSTSHRLFLIQASPIKFMNYRCLHYIDEEVGAHRVLITCHDVCSLNQAAGIKIQTRQAVPGIRSNCSRKGCELTARIAGLMAVFWLGKFPSYINNLNTDCLRVFSSLRGVFWVVFFFFLVMETACFKALGRKKKLDFPCCSSLLTVQSRNQGKRPPASERVVNWWRLVFLRLVCVPVSAVGGEHPKGSMPVLQQSYRRGSCRRAHQLAHLENNGEACWPFGTLQSSN